ncbi:MAG: Uma2 family endonuclease, partial [Stellaceae bacterium]
MLYKNFARGNRAENRDWSDARSARLWLRHGDPRGVTFENVRRKLMSLNEFLEWERDQSERFEYARGVTTMMTGGSLDHSTIASNLWTALREGLRSSGCRAFRGDTKVIANNSIRYPDLTVTTCSPMRGGDDVVPEPIVVIEVISPSTEREDRGRKKFDYFGTPSIRQYAIIEQDERRIDVYT